MLWGTEGKVHHIRRGRRGFKLKDPTNLGHRATPSFLYAVPTNAVTTANLKITLIWAMGCTLPNPNRWSELVVFNRDQAPRETEEEKKYNQSPMSVRLPRGRISAFPMQDANQTFDVWALDDIFSSNTLPMVPNKTLPLSSSKANALHVRQKTHAFERRKKNNKKSLRPDFKK